MGLFSLSSYPYYNSYVSLHPSGGPARRPEEPPSRPVQSVHPQALQAAIPPVEPMQPYQFQMYAPMQGAAPRPQPWVTVTPAQTHIHPPSSSSTHMMPPRSGPPHTHSSHQYRDDAWEGYNPPDDITPPNPPYDYRYRDDHSGWVSGPGPYYEPSVSKIICFWRKFSNFNIIPVRSQLWTILYGRPRRAFI